MLAFIAALDEERLRPAPGILKAVAFSPDGTLLATAKRDPWPDRAGSTVLMPRPCWCDSQRVNRWWPHRTAAACEQLIAELERAVPLDVATRACCCPARPVVTVVMPPTASRPHPVELLLCGHHFRTSQASLQAAGADVYDKAGLPIMAGTGTAGMPRPEAGRLVGTAHGYRD